jgi:molybdate transport system substrate-binding protein
MRFRRLIIALVFAASLARSGEIRVAAASDLTFVLDELGRNFQSATGNRVRATFGSSGNFVNQIENGAPFDVFLSADLDYPRRLVDAGLADPDSLTVYATGELVLWAPRTSLVAKGMDALRDPSVRRIAIANPEHAPYGRAAVAALKHDRLYDRVKDKLVLGENVSQAAQFTESGNAEVGIVPASLIAGGLATGSSWAIPREAYPPIEQGGVVLRRTRDPQTARAFLRYLSGAAARQVLSRYGLFPAGAEQKP